MQNLSQMTDVIDPLATAAKTEPEHIGHRVGSANSCIFNHYSAKARVISLNS